MFLAVEKYSDRVLGICNTIFHQALAVVTVFIFWTILYHNKPNTEFCWHMILSTLAYVPLMGEAIILFSNDNLWSKNIKRTTKFWIHGVILFVSALFVTTGIALLIHEKGNVKHFTSRHGWTGFVSWIFVLLSQIFGLAATRTQGFFKITLVQIKFIHNLFGILGYVFGIVSLCYGLETGAFKRLTTPEALKATYWMLGFTTLWSILAAFKSGYTQLKAIFIS